ncbi:MAG TPA: amidohydrolase family protein [Candidatus Hydrogenedentes bacterium]|nr:amidohydrolase family protein [Candidatus Hydrogenedentota bacterium]
MGSKKRKKQARTDDAANAVRPPRGTKENYGVPRRKRNPVIFLWIGAIAGILAIGIVWTAIEKRHAPETRTEAVEFPGFAQAQETGVPFAELQAKKMIIDVHEHLGSLDLAPVYLEVMDSLGIGKMCLMGSSKFTLTLDEKYGFTKVDENNEELLKVVHAYPGRFEAWVAIDPADPEKLEKLKHYITQGATGLKLYSGHGYITKQNEYIFHPVAMDDPGMFPVYTYCQENFIPVCLHLNPHKSKKGFAEEFAAILRAFPDMKMVCPHFMLSSIQDTRLREYLDTFPNLYTDVSFGDFFMKERLTYISKHPEKFKKIFNDYPDRFMYGTDLVLIKSPRQTKEWVTNQHKAYLDMLTKDTYTSPLIPGETLRGVALPDWLLDRVLYKNYEEFTARRPKGTEITRSIDWGRMNVTPTGRKPGQAFPPPPKDSKDENFE